MLLCHHLCACVLHAMFMCLGLDLVSHAMCYCSPFVPFISFFSCFGLMVRTQSRPYGLCHRPYTKAHIQGFGSSYLHVYAMPTMFVRITYWLSMHLYTLAHMSMHESCLLVCCPCFNTMKLWTFNQWSC